MMHCTTLESNFIDPYPRVGILACVFFRVDLTFQPKQQSNKIMECEFHWWIKQVLSK
jgi:hypothetical protein